MKYLLVQISDLHVRGANHHLTQKLNQVKSFVAEKSESGEYFALVVVTGDIAHAGKAEEYAAFEAELSSISAFWDSKKIRHKFIQIPGNHDCDLKHPSSEIRTLMIKNTAPQLSRESTSPSSSVISSFLSVQSAFKAHCQKFNQDFSIESLVNSYVFDELGLVVNVLNTAWTSEISQTTSIPFILCEIKKLEHRPGFLNVTLHHHPNSWIDKSIVSDFKRQLNEKSDFVLTGHEHDSLTSKRDYLSGDTQTYFEAGRFHEDGAEDGMFRIVKVNTELKQFNVTDYVWSEEKGYFKPVESGDINMPSVLRANAKGYSVTPTFIKFLADPGMVVQHALKRDLELKDFFVFPRITITLDQFDDSKTLKWITSANDFIDTMFEKQLTLVTAGDKAGKSSLCKAIFEGLFFKGHVPILLSGAELQSTSPKVIANLLEEKLKQQYGERELDGVIADPDLKLVAIIDSFDQSTLSATQLGQVVDYLKRSCAAILFTADTSIEVQVLNDPKFGVSIGDMNRLKIAPFNMVQRKELMAKWRSLGNSVEVTPDCNTIHQLEMALSSGMSQIGVPSHPFFIIVSLQGVETNAGLDQRYGSNAKLMEKVVEQALSGVNSDAISYETKFAYVRSLAFELFSANKLKLSADAFQSFHDEYCRSLDLSLSAGSLWRALGDAKILEFEEDGAVSFRYPFVRSFFVADYFRFFGSSPQVKNALKEVVENVHLAENAAILSTLSVYSAEDWMLKTLTSKLDSYLQDLERKSFSELSDIVAEVTKVQDVKLMPSKQNADECDDHDLDRPAGKIAARIENAEAERYVVSITTIIRHIKVVGQLLRNSINSLSGLEKRRVVDSVIAASDRIISLHVQAIVQAKDELVQHFAERIREKNPSLAEFEVASQTRAKLAQLSATTAVGLLDTVSRAIGDEELRQTYRKIEGDDKEGRTNFYFAAIKLDWFDSFPKGEVEDLWEEVEKKPFARAIAQYLVLRSIAFRGNGVQYATLQLVSQKYGVDYEKLINRRRVASKPSHDV